VKILDALKRKVRKAGLNCELCMGCAARKECHRFHTHYFRSSFASYALERNHIRKVQAWMGHSDLETLSKYVGLADRCPDWLASLYVERQVISSPQEEMMPASIVLPDSVISAK
jgi:integrase